MRGYPEHRVKGTGSLRRKLIAEVAELLQIHRDDVTFTPDMNDCVTAIHDCLRYTICFPEETYTESVKAVERELFSSGIARRIKFKNFWQDEDLMSTYMGLNSQVEICGLSHIPNSDGFIFELQFHTPGSFNRKNGPGHYLYEKFRDPAIKSGTLGGRHYEGNRYRQIL